MWRVDFVRSTSASIDHLDLVFASEDWPIPACLADDLDLLEKVALVPAKSDLCDLVVLVEVDKVSLGILA